MKEKNNKGKIKGDAEIIQAWVDAGGGAYPVLMAERMADPEGHLER